MRLRSRDRIAGLHELKTGLGAPVVELNSLECEGAGGRSGRVGEGMNGGC